MRIAFCWVSVAPDPEMNVPKFRALPNSASQTTGWISDVSSWIGFVYHFLKSLFVSAHSPCRGLLLSFGEALTTICFSAETSLGLFFSCCLFACCRFDFFHTYSLILRSCSSHRYALSKHLHPVSFFFPQAAAGKFQICLVQGWLRQRDFRHVKSFGSN